jgi:hypothetical protein
MMLFGAMAGATAEFSTYPFEVVRRRMQLQGGAASLSHNLAGGVIRTCTHSTDVEWADFGTSLPTPSADAFFARNSVWAFNLAPAFPCGALTLCPRLCMGISPRRYTEIFLLTKRVHASVLVRSYTLKENEVSSDVGSSACSQ